MLDQRRAKEKGYITLKEAAKIANYSPDYVGQLIRGGKIKGEQVYANTAWVTTTDEVLAYMKNKQRTVSNDDFQSHKVVTLVQKISSYTLYMIIALCVVALLFMQYVLYVSIDAGIEDGYLSKVHEPEVIDQIVVSASSL